MAALGPDLHPGEHVGVDELARPEGSDRGEDDARHLAEDLFVGALPVPARVGRQRDDDPDIAAMNSIAAKPAQMQRRARA
jgi:hypothetical protein